MIRGSAAADCGWIECISTTPWAPAPGELAAFFRLLMTQSALPHCQSSVSMAHPMCTACLATMGATSLYLALLGPSV